MVKKEKEYYPIVMQKFKESFESKGRKLHLEITSNKKFSNELKSRIPDHRHIIFYFLKEMAPDITGFTSDGVSTDFIVIEVKDEAIKLDNVYQTRKYAELFDAKFAFLVSTKEIPEEIKRLHKTVYSLLYTPSIYRAFVLVYFDEKIGNFVEWYPENPFEKELYWR